MKKRTEYADEPMEFTIIPDFLPSPEELATRLKKVRVTLEIDASTAEVFRRQAGGRRDDGSKMMGKLLDVYADRELRQ